MKNLLVMKFGGSSVGSAERMRVAARLSSEQRKKRPLVIVVSAMSGVTDLLLDATKHAEAGDPKGLAATIHKLEERHEKACRELLPRAAQKAARAGIKDLIGEFDRISRGMLMLHDRPPRSVDEAIAVGERLSALLIAAFLNAEGTPAAAVNAAELIVTDAVFGNASPVMEQTSAKSRARLFPLLEEGVLPVVTGFNGATAEWPPDYAGPRRLGFLGVHSGCRARGGRAMDLDRRRWHHDRRPAPGSRCRRAARSHLSRSRRAGLQRRQSPAPANARAVDGPSRSGLEQEQFRAGKARHENCFDTFHAGRRARGYLAGQSSA